MPGSSTRNWNQNNRTRGSSRTRSSCSRSGRAIRRTSRPGTTWCEPGVEVVTPNVFSSGGAKWNLMAAYGAQLNQGKSPEEALEFLRSVLEHAVVQPGSAADALTAFTSGKGDVLLSYESEAIKAQDAGEEIDYVVPDDTILIETPAATTTDASTQAQDFLTYLWTPEAQQLWADGGYRPVDKSVLAKNKDKFPVPPGLFDIDQPRRLGEGEHRVLRSRDRQRRQDRERSGGLHRVTPVSSMGAQSGGAPEAGRIAASRGRRAWAWSRHRVPEPDRADPDRRPGRPIDRGRARCVLDVRDVPAGGFGPEAHPDRVGDRGRRST